MDQQINQKYSNRILLCVTGMSPQIVTETLYALVTSQQFIPTEIRLITTIRGRNKVKDGLLNDNTGQFHNFCREYGLEEKIHFDESCIEVITDRYGKELDDIRTLEENTLAADKIVNIVRNLCQDETSVLHVSMAGGRKTMGFYIGYALSLFARPQDRLSHVLVSAPYENCDNFYYPSAIPLMITLADGSQIDASKAEVTLANIPLVRLRSSLPKQFMTHGNYSDTVAALQKNLPEEIRFDIPSRKILFSAHAPITLEASHFAVVLWLAKRQKMGQPNIHLNEDIHGNLLQEYLKIYAQVVSTNSKTYDNLQEKIQMSLSKEKAKDKVSINPAYNENIKLLKSYMSARFSHIKKEIGKIMGSTFGDKFIQPKKGTYGISLAPEAIILPTIKI